MLPWPQRPLEANLFNPAYCALLLRQAVEGYQKTALRGLDYAAAFMVLPVVLHQATRDLLPGTIATKLHFWAQRHHEVRIGFAQRMQDLVPITKEALLFGLQHDALQLNEAGALVVGPRRLPAYEVAPDSEVAACLNKLHLIICAAGSIILTSLNPLHTISQSLKEPSTGVK